VNTEQLARSRYI